MGKNTRGSIALAAILVVATLATTMFVASEYNLLGAIIGVETISNCNIAVYESIDNILIIKIVVNFDFPNLISNINQ